jgi:hypothetical protein
MLPDDRQISTKRDNRFFRDLPRQAKVAAISRPEVNADGQKAIYVKLPYPVTVCPSGCYGKRSKRP